MIKMLGILMLALALAMQAMAANCDLVILNGRVMVPRKENDAENEKDN